VQRQRGLDLLFLRTAVYQCQRTLLQAKVAETQNGIVIVSPDFSLEFAEAVRYAPFMGSRLRCAALSVRLLRKVWASAQTFGRDIGGL
jgi:hypothetical protein